MVTQNNGEFEPKVLEAFLGEASLKSVQERFETLEALLETYGQFQSVRFSARACSSNRCDLCESKAPIGAWLAIIWAARLRRHTWRITMLLAMMTLLLPLGLSHLPYAMCAMFQVPLRAKLGFVTYHAVCPICMKRMKPRFFAHGAWLFLVGFIGVISGAAATILGATLVAMYCSAFNVHPRDSFEILPLTLGASLLTCLMIFAGRIFSLRIEFPSAVRTLMKLPFACQDIRILDAHPSRAAKPFG